MLQLIKRIITTIIMFMHERRSAYEKLKSPSKDVLNSDLCIN